MLSQNDIVTLNIRLNTSDSGRLIVGMNATLKISPMTKITDFKYEKSYDMQFNLEEENKFDYSVNMLFGHIIENLNNVEKKYRKYKNQ